MLVLHGVDVVVGNGKFLRKTNVGVECGRIVKIGKNLSGSDTLDLSGMTLLPGLMDAHVHLVMSGEVDPNAIRDQSASYLALVAWRNANRTLEAGFTTVRDLGSPAFVNLAVKLAIKNGTVPGPRVFASGQVIAMTGGHGSNLGARIADGPFECAKAAREQIQAGADVIKLMATGGVLTMGSDPQAFQLNEDEMAAAVREAHKAGKSAAAHAHGTKGIKNAIRSGVDSIEHGTYADEEALDMMLSRGTSLVICIHATEAPTLPEAQQAGIPTYITEKNRLVLNHQLDTLRYALGKGVNVVMGTDAGTPLNPHGDNAKELSIFVANGMSEMAAIEATTLQVARLLDIEESLGSVEIGKIADLIAVEQNPLEDIASLEDVAFVMKEGKIMKDKHTEH
ncbi:MAG: amidohydrolase family protein [Nitrospiraceae bacterium]|nr:amidohydrolase family protein [Nitrospiraceae bacterium]